MLPGESILSGAPDTCSDCKKRLEPKVMRSPAGYYIGTSCDCGPYSRESDYFKDREAAEKALPLYRVAVAGLIEVVPIPQKRTTDYRPGGLTVEILDDDLNPTGETL